MLLSVKDVRAKTLIHGQVVEVSSLSVSVFLFLQLSIHLSIYLSSKVDPNPQVFSAVWTCVCPKLVQTPCFWHFDLEMRFAPQHRAIFRHPNLQKRGREY